MTIKPGSLLIAHPIHSAETKMDAVVFVTESHSRGTLGVRLNLPAPVTMTHLMQQKNLSWSGPDSVYSGGEHNQGALILLHDGDWYSSNTMPIDPNWSISSDQFMLDKMCRENYPREFRICLGVTAWDTDNITSSIRSNRPRWLLLEDPDPDLITAPAGLQWDMAVVAHSQNLFDSYF